MCGGFLSDGDAKGKFALNENILPHLSENENDVLNDLFLTTTEGDGSAFDRREVLRLEKFIIFLNGGGVRLEDLGKKRDGRSEGLEFIVKRNGFSFEDIFDELKFLEFKFTQTEKTKEGIRTTVGEDGNGLIVGTFVFDHQNRDRDQFFFFFFFPEIKKKKREKRKTNSALRRRGSAMA